MSVKASRCPPTSSADIDFFLQLLTEGHRVYIIADGVSSCNEAERPIALDRLRAEGAIVTTSESWMYECMGDAGIPE